MKIYFNILLVLSIGIFSCTTSRNAYSNYDDNNYQQYDNSGPISYQTFYDQLSPYGMWVNYPGYGYVWSPSLSGFRPYYSNGQWAYSSYGWTWVSNYNWGWAPFHYGRWMDDPFYGWLWVPGYEWAPAWVAWRGGGDYYGWAPIGPGFGFNSYGSIPYDNYCFVPRRYINSPRINNYYIDRRKNVTIINNTTIINNNITYNKNIINAGPSVRDVEQATNSTIRPAQIVNRRTPGESNLSNGKIAIYKPAITESVENKNEAKPTRVFSTDQLSRTREAQKLPSASSQNGVRKMDGSKNIELAPPQKENIENNDIRRNPQSEEPRTNNLPKPLPQKLPAKVDNNSGSPVPINEKPPVRVFRNQPMERSQAEGVQPAPHVRNFPRQNDRQEKVPQTRRPQEERVAPRPVQRVERDIVQPPVREERAPVQREFRPAQEAPARQDK
ncbi:MAG: hypothetical protein JSS98_13920 [Bacteroidetes bacterium]|nr:hypothetical protein [Bacteroidota bacterium]